MLSEDKLKKFIKVLNSPSGCVTNEKTISSKDISDNEKLDLVNNYC